MGFFNFIESNGPIQKVWSTLRKSKYVDDWASAAAGMEWKAMNSAVGGGAGALAGAAIGGVGGAVSDDGSFLGGMVSGAVIGGGIGAMAGGYGRLRNDASIAGQHWKNFMPEEKIASAAAEAAKGGKKYGKMDALNEWGSATWEGMKETGDWAGASARLAGAGVTATVGGVAAADLANPFSLGWVD